MRLCFRARGVLLFSALILSGWLTGPTDAASLTVVNPSFESPALSDGVWNTSPPTGWALTGVGGVVNFSDALYNLRYDDPIPDRVQVGWIHDGSLTQTLTDNLTANTEYALTVYVGNRKDDLRIDNYEVKLLAGGVAIASSGTNPMMPARGGWAPYTLTYTTGPGDAHLGEPVGIKLIAWTSSTVDLQTDFDMVSLTATPTVVPIPGAFLLFGPGLLGLIGLRRKMCG